MKNTRWALWKNPENLTDAQQAKLAWIARTHPRLHRAWALKEGLRLVLTLTKASPVAAAEALDRWIGWARRSRLDISVNLQRRVTRHRDQIIAAIEHGLPNGRIESVNAKIRLITRRPAGIQLEGMHDAMCHTLGITWGRRQDLTQSQRPRRRALPVNHTLRRPRCDQCCPISRKSP